MEKNLRCLKCGKEMQEGMKYCPYCGTAVAEASDSILTDTSVDSAERGIEEKHIKRSASGIIGMLGVLIGCVGMFMPFLSAWGQKTSYYGLLVDSGENIILGGILFFVIFEFFLFYYEVSAAGNIFAIVAFVLFLMTLLNGDNNGMTMNEIMNYVDTGFWIMCVGLIMMSVSSLFGTTKK